jgi:hypothetical protein
MTEKKYFQEGEIVKKGAVRAIQRVGNNLDALTINLDRELPQIEAGKMPEYVEARNAIGNYKLAVQNKIDLLNKGVEHN